MKGAVYPGEWHVGDGSTRSETDPEVLFELTDVSWNLIPEDGTPGMSCGLLSSRFDVHRLDRRLCRLLVSGREEPFRSELVLRAPASSIQRQLDRRLSALQDAATQVAAVDQGAWWLDERNFQTLGPLRTTSIAGVRRERRRDGSERPRRSIFTKVLDFGPRGVALRGWRTHLLMPWSEIDSVEVLGGSTITNPVGDDTSAGFTASERRTLVLVRSVCGEVESFTTTLSTPAAVLDQLAPLLRRLNRPVEPEGRARPQPRPVPSLHAEEPPE